MMDTTKHLDHKTGVRMKEPGKQFPYTRHKISIPGYSDLTFQETTFEFIRFHSYDTKNRKPVDLVFFPYKFFSSAQTSRILFECERMKNIRSPHVLAFYRAISGKIAGDEGIFFVYEAQKHMVPLQSEMNALKPDLVHLLLLFQNIAQGLSDIHRHDVIHGNIRPNSILIHPESQEIKLRDYGFPTRVASNRIGVEALQDEAGRRNVLPYISPEQTGRINRMPDFRTDFYSLGAMLYEALSGAPLFASAHSQFPDGHEIIHAHIARKPPSLASHTVSRNRQNGIDPPYKTDLALSDIVMKMLAKAPDKRYQSARGIVADLDICVSRLIETGKIDFFALAKNDYPHRFSIPQRIFGRDTEISTLYEIFNRMEEPEKQMVRITGEPGTGKTHLIQEIKRSLFVRKAYFLSGKFDQFRSHVPYSALIQAFEDWVDQVRMENEISIEKWQRKLATTLGGNAGLLCDVIPALSRLLPENPIHPTVEGRFLKSRFDTAIFSFLRLIAKKEHPLILFLDDLQWADTASLKLLKSIISESSVGHMAFLFSYRSKKGKNDNPELAGWIRDFRKTGIPDNHIHLSELTPSDVQSLLSETLKQNNEAVRELAGIVQTKTRGNPFFVKQFLENLYEEGMIQFDTEKGFVWDMEKIRQAEITDNVVDFISERFTRLPLPVRTIVSRAASIGNPFDLVILSKVTGLCEKEILENLDKAVQSGILLTTENGYRFSHDRTHDAAYRLLSKEMRLDLHYQIARILLAGKKKGEDISVFEIADQFNHCIDKIHETSERHEVLLLNLEAGRMAKNAAAFEPASVYFEHAAACLEENSWQTHPDLPFQAFRELSECDFLLGKQEKALNRLRGLLDKTKEKSHKADIYNLLMVLHTNLGEYEQALSIGVDALKLFGIHLPEAPGGFRVLTAFMKVRMALRKKPFEKLMELPLLQDSEREMAMKLLITLTIPAYFSNNVLHKNLLNLAIFKMLNITLVHGVSKYASWPYVWYGVIAGRKFGDYKTGYSFGKLGVMVNERFDNTELSARVHLIFAGFVSFWNAPAEDSLYHMRKAIRIGLENGDVLFTSYAMTQEFYHSYRKGAPLSVFSRKYNRVMEFLLRVGNLESADTVESIYLMIRKLRDEKEVFGQEEIKMSCPYGGYSLSGTKQAPDVHLFAPDSAEKETGHGKQDQSGADTESGMNENQGFFSRIQNKRRLYYVYLRTRVETAYLLGQTRQAVLEGDRIYHDVEKVIVGTIHLPEFYFYYGLSMAEEIFRRAKAAGQKTLAVSSDIKNYEKRIPDILKRFEKWAENAPENFAHQYILLQAEQFRTKGKPDQALSCYRRAIQKACDHGYINHEALCMERLGIFYLEQNDVVAASSYIKLSRKKYVKWGAKAKVRQMEMKYADILTETAPDKKKKHVEPFDYSYVVQSLLAISQEIVFETLLKKLLKIVVENAGAERAVYITVQNRRTKSECAGSLSGPGDKQDRSKGEKYGEGLFVDAELVIQDGGEKVEVRQIPVEEKEDIPRSVIDYVKRTLTHIVVNLEDFASAEGRENAGYRPRSVLCLPVIRQKELVGILLVENTVTADAFLENQISVLSLIASQAAISIENARLYEELKDEIVEKKEAERKLLKSESRLKTLLETANEGFVEVDKEAVVIDVNPEMCEILGRAKEEVLGWKVMDFLSGDNLRILAEQMELRKKGRRSEYEISYQRPDGRYVHCLSKATPIFNGNVQTGAFAMITDITHRKQAEEELLRLASAIRHAAEGFIITEIDGTVRFVNPAFERITGYSEEEILSRNFGIMGKEGQDAVYDEMWHTISKGHVFSGHIVERKKNGEIIELDVTVSPIKDAKNKINSFVAVTRDVTRMMKMEKQLRQAQKMEAIGRLAGGIAHDFNNILAAIVGFTELAQDNLPKDSQERYQLEKVLGASERAANLVQQILAFCRQTDYEIKPVDIRIVVKEALKLLRASLPTTIEIRQNIKDHPLVVKADPTQIHQVVMNLCTNAAQSMENQPGILELDLFSMGVDSTDTAKDMDLSPGQYVCIKVGDTGCGMSREIMDRMFDPFFTTKAPGTGTGMGLSVTHGIVEVLGGEIRVESTPSKGTVFKIFLPELDSQPCMISEKNQPPPPGGEERILFVDDEEPLTEMVKEIFTKLGYRVSSESSSANALKLFLQKPKDFDLIITDYTMPEMTGIEMARKMLDIRPDIPVILCSGYGEEITQNNMEESGVCRFVRKPFAGTEMARVIREVLDSGKN